MKTQTSFQDLDSASLLKIKDLLSPHDQMSLGATCKSIHTLYSKKVSFQDLDPASLLRIKDLLSTREQTSLGTTCKSIRHTLFSKDEIERLTYTKVHHLATNFAETAQRAADNVPSRRMPSCITSRRKLFHGADILVKKAFDQERSPIARAAYLGLAVGALPLGLAANIVAPFADIIVMPEIDADNYRRASYQKRVRRHDGRRAVRNQLQEFQQGLFDVPRLVSSSKLLEALAPATAYLKDVSAHEKLRMRQPDVELEKFATRLASSVPASEPRKPL